MFLELFDNIFHPLSLSLSLFVSPPFLYIYIFYTTEDGRVNEFRKSRNNLSMGLQMWTDAFTYLATGQESYRGRFPFIAIISQVEK